MTYFVIAHILLIVVVFILCFIVTVLEDNYVYPERLRVSSDSMYEKYQNGIEYYNTITLVWLCIW